ncbi:nucleotidyltransferase family protein [Neobacillus sp. 179-C4.2 HS]|uniref:Nucleotidyltransferase family protein n=1 Tax=Neobacillus driksii TaxID=3035913 RepID=A0ABV4Z0L6_9BACI|nr:nucleotidyltransferase family protein [Neobacillus sp. 179.-C4.2 HS]MDP5195996.1 nucleotidyltransferase family protein [Neobacillus sp. 179.-C4.2 HS]
MDKNFKLELTNFPKELILLLEIMKLEENDRLEALKIGYFEDVNWDMFLQLVKHHRIYPTIYLKLRKLTLDWIPTYVKEELSILYKNNTIKMLYLSGEMEQISKLLADSKIELLFLKGPILATALYGDLSHRTCSDLDILIPISKLEEAEKLLLEDGYIKDDYIVSVLNDWKWRHHHITFYHPKKKIKLEIHWRLNPGPSKEPKFADLWKRKRLSSLTNRYPIYYLGNEDLFVFLVTHGARHGWSRLRWLIDIVELSKQDLNSTEIIRLLRKYQTPHLGGQVLILNSELFNVNLNEKMLELVGGTRSEKLAQEALFYIRQMINLHTYPLPQEVDEYHKKHLFSLMSNRQKFFYILSFLYPFAIDTETLPLPKILHFLYFPLRPILLLWRKTRKGVIARRV